MNRTTLSGNLTRTPELRHTSGGTAFLQVSLAVDKFTKAENGEFEKTAIFPLLKLWGKQAETLSRIAKKGSFLVIDGVLDCETWETQGEKNTQWVVKVTNFEMPKQPGEASESAQPEAEPAPKAPPPQPAELPF